MHSFKSFTAFSRSFIFTVSTGLWTYLQGMDIAPDGTPLVSMLFNGISDICTDFQQEIKSNPAKLFYKRAY